MKLTHFLAAAGVIVAIDAGKLPKEKKCNNNNLARCLVASSSVAAEYCSGLVGPVTNTATTVTTYQTITVSKVQTVDVPVVQTLLAKRKNPHPEVPSGTPACVYTKNYKSTSLAHACSCFLGAGEPTMTITTTVFPTATVVSTKLNYITTKVTKSSSMVSGSTVVSSTSSALPTTSTIPEPAEPPICFQAAPFIAGWNTMAILVDPLYLSSQRCKHLCSTEPTCKSWVRSFQGCYIFGVRASAIIDPAGGYGMYQITDAVCDVPLDPVLQCGMPATLDLAGTRENSIDFSLTSAYECSGTCANLAMCKSFAYDPDHGVCSLFAVDIATLDPLTDPVNGVNPIEFFDGTCSVDAIPLPACGGTGLSTARPSYSEILPSIEECGYQCAQRGCVSISWDPDNTRCKLYSMSVQRASPISSISTNTVWYDAVCAPALVRNCAVKGSPTAISASKNFGSDGYDLSQQRCATRCRADSRCLSYAIHVAYERCLLYSGEVANLGLTTVDSATYWDLGCAVTPDPVLACGAAALLDGIGSSKVYFSSPGLSPDDCGGQCNLDGDCQSYNWDPYSMTCTFFKLNIADLDPQPDPDAYFGGAIEFFDRTCPIIQLANPSCGVSGTSPYEAIYEDTSSTAESCNLACQSYSGCVSSAWSPSQRCLFYNMEVYKINPVASIPSDLIYSDVSCLT